MGHVFGMVKSKLSVGLAILMTGLIQLTSADLLAEQGGFREKTPAQLEAGSKEGIAVDTAELAHCHLVGNKGVPKNFEKATELTAKALEQGIRESDLVRCDLF